MQRNVFLWYVLAPWQVRCLSLLFGRQLRSWEKAIRDRKVTETEIETETVAEVVESQSSLAVTILSKQTHHYH